MHPGAPILRLHLPVRHSLRQHLVAGYELLQQRVVTSGSLVLDERGWMELATVSAAKQHSSKAKGGERKEKVEGRKEGRKEGTLFSTYLRVSDDSERDEHSP